MKWKDGLVCKGMWLDGLMWGDSKCFQDGKLIVSGRFKDNILTLKY